MRNLNLKKPASNMKSNAEGLEGIGMSQILDPPEHYNKWQKAHHLGTFNVYEPIEQEDGSEPLPPLAVQWKEDARRRFGNNANTRYR